MTITTTRWVRIFGVRVPVWRTVRRVRSTFIGGGAW